MSFCVNIKSPSGDFAEKLLQIKYTLRGIKEAYTLADKISSAWLNFAKTGDPNAKGLPKWPKYTPENGATMIFDNTCELKNAPDKELLQIASGK